MMNNDIAIKVEHVSKSFEIPHEQRNTFRERVITLRKKTTYEKFCALQDVSLEIRKGEFFGIIGRNGSGKSTLLKILAGIYTPDSGSVVVNGRISPFLELGVGFNPELSGKDNIFLNGTLLGLTYKEIEQNYHKIVEFSELERFIHLKVKNYSSGMQVRLAFSVAIHANKEILLMDEVLAVGDASFQIKCFEIFEKIIKEGKTIIFVSHDTHSIQKYSDRVAFLKTGRLLYIGNPIEAISTYMYSDIIPEIHPANTEPTSEALNNIENSSGNIVKEHQTMTSVVDLPSRIIEIIEVKFFDLNGEETDLLQNGCNFRISVICNVKKPLENVILGIIIRNNLHEELFTTNTYSENISTGIIEPGIIEAQFDLPNYFAQGKYSVTPAVCDRTQRIFYDLKNDFAFFHVQNLQRRVIYSGLDVPHSINILTQRTQ